MFFWTGLGTIGGDMAEDDWDDCELGRRECSHIGMFLLSSASATPRFD